MSWSDRAFTDWRKLLGTQPTTVDGRPNPVAIDLLRNIDLLLKTSPQIKTARILRIFRPFILPIILPIWIATLAYVMFCPLGHNSIAISARVKSVSFTLDSDGESAVLK